MILCTNCGTKNPDDAASCVNCGRKLQSRWARGGANGQNAANGQNGGAKPAAEQVWQLIEPILQTVDENAGRMVRAAAETWVYGLMLIAGSLATVFTENWWYLGGCVALAAALAWVRGI